MGALRNAAVHIDVFEDCHDIDFTGVVVNQTRAECDQTLLELPVLWSDDIADLANDHLMTCSIATTLRKDWINDRIAAGFQFVQLFHPSSVISRRTSFGQGAIVDALVVVAGFSEIADHVRIGRRASIGHHTTIGEFSTIHPGATISGNCNIGQQVTVGTGAVIIDGTDVGDGAFIAAGAVVIRDVPCNAMIGGNPAKILREDYGPR